MSSNTLTVSLFPFPTHCLCVSFLFSMSHSNIFPQMLQILPMFASCPPLHLPSLFSIQARANLNGRWKRRRNLKLAKLESSLVEEV